MSDGDPAPLLLSRDTCRTTPVAPNLVGIANYSESVSTGVWCAPGFGTNLGEKNLNHRCKNSPLTPPPHQKEGPIALQGPAREKASEFGWACGVGACELTTTFLPSSRKRLQMKIWRFYFGRREKTRTPKTRFGIWTLLSPPGRFTTRPLPVYFTTKISVVRPFSVLSKDEIGP